MSSKSIFLNSSIDFQMLHHPNNFEDSLTRDDIQGCLYPSSSQSSLAKVSSWHSFSLEHSLKQVASANASPNGTPQSSPYNARKQFDATGHHQSDQQMKKRWFNSHIFGTFSDANMATGNGGTSDPADSGNSYFRKSNSYKNVSNFDINAVGPISF